MRVALACLLLLLVSPALAGEAPVIAIGYLGEERPPPLPLGPLDVIAPGKGLEGARLAIADNETTGRFLGQRYSLVERILPAGGDAADAMRRFAGEGVAFVVSDLDADQLIKAADSPAARALTLINSRAPDDELRNGSCRANVLHTIPSRAMLADGLAQYLVSKGWRRWFLVSGPDPGDQARAAAIRRSALRFGAEIAVDKPWTFRPANGRADTGHVTLEAEIPAFTQGADYDVLVVADEADQFGAYLEGRTTLPRPVAGTQGLVATGWSAVSEEWGATQLESRFHRAAGRWMTDVDYAAWAAVRSIGEAATRSRSVDPAAIAAYLRGPDFLLAGFKGQALSYRPWDGQMRQPILIAGPRLLVSVAPEPGFLHQRDELDTLGTDLEESGCRK